MFTYYDERLTFSARYPMVLEQSTDNGAAARQQILTIIKFFFASVSYNSEEIAKDFHLMCEYSMFSQSFVTEIKRLYMFVVVNQKHNFCKIFTFIFKLLIKGKTKTKYFISYIIKLMNIHQQAIQWLISRSYTLYLKSI